MAEQIRTLTVEAKLNESLLMEKNRATVVEISLQNSINTGLLMEFNRAITAEATLNASLLTLQNNINAEQIRGMTEEASLRAQFNNFQAVAMAAINNLSSSLQSTQSSLQFTQAKLQSTENAFSAFVNLVQNCTAKGMMTGSNGCQAISNTGSSSSAAPFCNSSVNIIVDCNPG